MVRRRRAYSGGFHIDGRTVYRVIRNGIIFTAAIVAGVNGYINGIRGLERLWPSLIEKITLTRAAASVVAGYDNDDDYDD